MSDTLKPFDDRDDADYFINSIHPVMFKAWVSVMKGVPESKNPHLREAGQMLDRLVKNRHQLTRQQAKTWKALEAEHFAATNTELIHLASELLKALEITIEHAPDFDQSAEVRALIAKANGTD